jgi:hypothetical protein
VLNELGAAESLSRADGEGATVAVTTAISAAEIAVLTVAALMLSLATLFAVVAADSLSAALADPPS